MVKRDGRKESKKEGTKMSDVLSSSNAATAFAPVANQKTLDPTLASLFASSAGPVQAPAKSRYLEPPLSKPRVNHQAGAASSDEDLPDAEHDDEELSSVSSVSSQEDVQFVPDESAAEADPGAAAQEASASLEDTKLQRKRRRKADDEELEDTYMRRLAREEAKEDDKLEAERASKRQKKVNGHKSTGSASDSDSEAEDVPNDDPDSDGAQVLAEPVPQHESLAPSQDALELEKSARTVFLANVSTSAITSTSDKKILLTHLASFISTLPSHTPPHKVESLRFRSTAYSSAIPKKAAFAKKELMDATTKSTNAYAVYSTQLAAREAAKKLNGTIVLDRHLRVDEVAHPAKTDHKRCVFVGNLGFVDDEGAIQAADDEEGKRKARKNIVPSDVEEGLWRQFGKAGTVESVRVVRDPKTRVGKGFAYVQFTDPNAVEAALLYNEKRFPPLLPRKLRVTRAKSIKRNAKSNAASTRPPAYSKPRTAGGVYNPKTSSQQASQLGRAGKLLGTVGGARMCAAPALPRDARPMRSDGGAVRSPTDGFRAPESFVQRVGAGGSGGPGLRPSASEGFVFEGHRASSKQGKSGLKLGGSGKKKGKPRTRSSKRGAAWKAGGGKK
ncbi:hypothetical protein B0A49_10432 [Cryomyces minteri]|uniref:Nucleolar protein 12 n=1 Tax=Cryomyces minteri TaxID=331657 RepID=A0A4U0WMA0_9PEZI|nr:hypothetical protein B0A49_10432 [Cryomyces minteri]